MTNATPRATGEITQDADGFTVTVAWDVDVQRNRTYAWGLGPRHGALARRLKRAIDAQVVCINPVIKKDVSGATFVSAEETILGRHMNADLRRLGF